MGAGNKPVQVRVDDETRARWQAAADTEGVALPEWIRRVANQALNREALVLASEIEPPDPMVASMRESFRHPVDTARTPSTTLPQWPQGGKVFKGPDPKSSRERR